MPTHTLTVDGFGSYEVEAGTKLVLALEQNGVDVSHRCGGQAKCTTCRVGIATEAPPMGDAERDSLAEDGVLGSFRLSCQIRVDRDLRVNVLMRASDKGWDPGAEVEP
ncbi:MAG: 2Fe-2S iron-sulfur cluster-binding protein [Fimbriimonadaceae bacterium]|nr:2Fe-2S iron-sulfur cluster-binding protein [Fimbriimonadaceae bacterium]